MVFGFSINSCCSGHLHDSYFSPYITFYAHQYDDDPYAISEANLRKLKKAYNFFVRLQEEGIIVCEIEMFEKDYKLTIRPDIDPDKDQLSQQEKLRVQFNFLNFLYKFIDEFEKASNGKIKKSAKKEEQSLLQI